MTHSEPCHITDSAPMNNADVDPDTAYQGSVQSTIDKAERPAATLGPDWAARCERQKRDVDAIMAFVWKDMSLDQIRTRLEWAWTDGRFDGMKSAAGILSGKAP